MKTALVLGATGLVGSKLTDALLADKRFEKVVMFVRRSTGRKHPRLEEHVVSFDSPGDWRHLVNGDVLFSAFGTTLNKAGTKEAQYKIDYTYQYQMAEAAAANQVPVYVLVSAAGSSPDSRLFYSRMKGELDRAVSQLPFKAMHILRPGMLAGNRAEQRPMELIGTPVLRLLSLIPGLGALKPIYDRQVAAAMIHVALSERKGVHIYGIKELFGLAAAYEPDTQSNSGAGLLS